MTCSTSLSLSGTWWRSSNWTRQLGGWSFPTFSTVSVFTSLGARRESVLGQGSEELEKHANYWEAVVKFVLQEQASNLLIRILN